MTAETDSKTPDRPSFVLTRRQLLKMGLIGVPALLAGGAGGLWALRGWAPEVPGLLVLSGHDYRTVTALARVHLPAGGPFTAGAGDFDLARMLDGFLADEPPENARDLRWGIWMLEYGPVFFDARFAIFSNLPEVEQLAHWQSWLVSSSLLRRQVATALRKFLSFSFYAEPEVALAIGYELPKIWE